MANSMVISPAFKSLSERFTIQELAQKHHLHQYNKTNTIPLRSRVFAYINDLNELGGKFPRIYNFFLSNPVFAGMAKKILGVAKERTLPTIHIDSLKSWYTKHYIPKKSENRSVILFCDEFTNWNDTHIGIKTIQLLQALNYDVQMVTHYESGRAAISKGLLNKAKYAAEQNISIFKDLINDQVPLIGIEPSAILSFRDEYPRLVNSSLVEAAKKVSKHTFLIDEFLANEFKSGRINAELFSKQEKNILLHGHCHQKSLSAVEDSISLLSIPKNYTVSLIPSGCCGMAGSFGYEKNHYEVSQKIGNLVLFPAIEKANKHTIIAAPGTSCRHQIKEGTERTAYHPVEILFEALNT